ncbi:MAG: LapA family protein [Nitrospirae bacterium]|nr:LapA family protein [Nitrospirota bacterium]
MDFFYRKKFILPLIAVVFLFAVFIDENHVPVPMKFFIGEPFHLHLSTIILVSMLAGGMMTLLGVFLVNGIRTKLRKMKIEKELEI